MIVTELSRSPEETRQRILAATRTLMARKGRRGMTTREIAELAGVNEATLFRHFGHKEALIEQCVLHYCGAVELREALSGLGGELERDLCRLGTVLAERMESVRDLIIMSLAEEEDASIGDAAWRTPSAIRAIVADYMAKRVAEGELQGNPGRLARFFMGIIFAYVIGRKKFPEEDGVTTQQLVTFLVGIFLNGARCRI